MTTIVWSSTAREGARDASKNDHVVQLSTRMSPGWKHRLPSKKYLEDVLEVIHISFKSQRTTC